MIRILLQISIFTVLITLCACNGTENSNARPNILLINIDDMGWRDVGFMGSEFYETPVLDELAHGGMIFTRAYSSASNCAPSRACMMSGQYTPRHGIYTVNSSERGRSSDRKLIPVRNNTILADSCYTIAEALHDAGYVTCHAGKWHLSKDPLTQGFDLNIGGCHAGNPGSYYPPYKNVPLEAPADNYYLTNLVMDKLIEFVENVDKDKPFFIYYSPYAVHTPLHPVSELIPKYENKKEWKGQNNVKYATMVENLDRQVGRLVEVLESTNKMGNTFILFTSDNGGVYRITRQWPLRAGKGSYYEGGIREPMFVYWEGKVKKGSQNDVPVSNIDFYPTILDVAGIESRPGKVLDGSSLVSLIKGLEVQEERPLFWHFPIYLEGGNEQTQDPVFRTRPGSAVLYGDWKLIQYFEDGHTELYNLENDPGEKNNLAEKERDKRIELLNILETWRMETAAPVPAELNPEYKKN